jgi:uncharacterized protein (TIGR03790 family)
MYSAADYGRQRLSEIVRARSVRWWFLIVGLFSPEGADALAAERVGDRVVILANAGDPESLELARYYAEQRHVPLANIAALPMEREEVIDWHRFVATIFDPLQTWLLRHRWIDAIESELRDEVGRRKVASFGHRIEYLVVCRGVPLRIRDTDGIALDVPRGTPEALRTHRAAVDSELALLARSATPRSGVVKNALFGRDRPSQLEREQVVRVARLDGPSSAAVRRLIDSAVEGERRGLRGRAYVDLGGPSALGDRWLDAAARLLEGMGFETVVHRAPGTMLATASADEAAVYLGWYDATISGPFAAADYAFVPGAIALHIHSYSAHTLRREHDSGWCGPLVARGVAATFGNVDEPFLEYTHQPQLILRVLARGGTLGEAAYYALPVLSWQSIVIGDPLYRPFPGGAGSANTVR